jgi:pimeloyl-ACP methyl ester carboxylesterase
MQGNSEFTLSGVLEFWSVTEKLANLKIRTLILRGEFDTMSKECSELIAKSMPQGYATHVEVPRAAHCKLIDEPELCVAEIAKFLSSLGESGSAAELTVKKSPRL